MSWLLTADLHFDHRYIDRLQPTCEWIFDEFCKTKPNHVLLLGDIFNSRSVLDLDIFKLATDFIRKLSESNDWNSKIHIIVGNHDQANLNDRSVNSLVAFHNLNKNVYVYSEITETILDDQKVLMVPFHTDQSIITEYISSHIRAEELDKYVICAHISIGGMRMNGASVTTPNRLCTDPHMTVSYLQNFKMAFAGHYHNMQFTGEKNNVGYVGSPIQTSFADSGDLDRGIHIYNPVTNIRTFLPNPHADYYRSVAIEDVTAARNRCATLDLQNKKVQLFLDSLYSDEQVKETCAWLEQDCKVIAPVKVIKAERKKDLSVDLANEKRLDNDLIDLNSLAKEYLDSHSFDSDNTKKGLHEIIAPFIDDIKPNETDAVKRFSFSLKSLEITNFLGILDSVLVDFERLDGKGVYVIYGENGAGKSTLCEAIYWCLFGRSLRGLKNSDDVININAKRPAQVILTLNDGTRFIRRRGKAHKENKKTVKGEYCFTVNLPDNTLIQKGTIRDTELFVQKELLKILPEDFERMYLPSSSSLLLLLYANDKVQRDYISDILEIRGIKELHPKVKASLEQVKSLITTHNHQIALEELRVKQKEEHLANIVNSIVECDKNIKESTDELIITTEQESNHEISHQKLKAQLENTFMRTNEKRILEEALKSKQNRFTERCQDIIPHLECVLKTIFEDYIFAKESLQRAANRIELEHLKSTLAQLEMKSSQNKEALQLQQRQLSSIQTHKEIKQLAEKLIMIRQAKIEITKRIDALPTTDQIGTFEFQTCLVDCPECIVCIAHTTKFKSAKKVVETSPRFSTIQQVTERKEQLNQSFFKLEQKEEEIAAMIELKDEKIGSWTISQISAFNEIALTENVNSLQQKNEENIKEIIIYKHRIESLDNSELTAPDNYVGRFCSLDLPSIEKGLEDAQRWRVSHDFIAKDIINENVDMAKIISYLSWACEQCNGQKRDDLEQWLNEFCTMQQEIDETLSSITDINDDINTEKNDAFKEYNLSSDISQRLKEKIAILHNKINELHVKKETLCKNEQCLREELSTLNEGELNKLKHEVQDLWDKERQLIFWEQALNPSFTKIKGKNAFRSFCLQRRIDILNAAFSRNIQELCLDPAGGVLYNLDAHLSTDLELIAQPACVSVQARSDGQKKRTSLALYLALLEVSHATSHLSSNFLFFDEILNSLDDSGIEGMTRWLARYVAAQPSDRFRCFTISHHYQDPNLVKGFINIGRDSTGKTQIKID